jgi:dihydroorotate dehydrogenase
MNLFPLFKPLAFNVDPETVHDLSLKSFSQIPSLSKLFPSAINDPRYHLNDGHISWNFPVGLAAGFDKNANAFKFFENIGFGAVEVGTVTIKPQVGNPRPRIWRYPEDESIRNAMGFPNIGSARILENLNMTTRNSPLGVNIGKNKDTSIDNTPSEYARLYQMFCDVADYLVINISSPNTPGLRDLQTKESFRAICEAVDEKRKITYKPLYLKIAPDLNESDIRDLVELAKEFNLSGIIATNTTIQHSYDKGGMSGKHIKTISRDIRKLVCEMTKEVKDLSVIGVGGIDSFKEIQEFWNQGGSFVQIYTSFIFKGPKVLSEIQKDMDQFLKKTDFDSVQSYIDSLR